MGKYYAIYLIAIILLFTTCEPDHETVNVSRESHLPVFSIFGGEFISFEAGSQTWEDPGVEATVEGEPVKVVTFGPQVKVNEPNVYVFYYYAQNEDKITSVGRRVVAVTKGDVIGNDLSGKYLLYNEFGWPAVETKVKKKHEKGWYEAEEVFGYPQVETEGEFVDIGGGKLILLPGESIFGNYDIDEGNYDPRNLSWTIRLMEYPNAGVNIEVYLRRLDD